MPSQAAAGRLAYSSAEITSQAIISGRAGRRSTQTPAGKPMTSHGRYAAAVSAATAKVLARRTVTASNGTSTTASALPAPLIVSPTHSSRKFRCRSGPPGRRGPPGLMRQDPPDAAGPRGARRPDRGRRRDRGQRPDRGQRRDRGGRRASPAPRPTTGSREPRPGRREAGGRRGRGRRVVPVRGGLASRFLLGEISGERQAQGGPGPVQAAASGPLGHAEGRRGLRRGQLFPGHEQENVTFGRRQGADRGQQRPGPRRPVEAVDDGIPRILRHRRTGPRRLIRVPAGPPVPSQHVPGDAEQPRPGVGVGGVVTAAPGEGPARRARKPWTATSCRRTTSTNASGRPRADRSISVPSVSTSTGKTLRPPYDVSLFSWYCRGRDRAFA